MPRPDTDRDAIMAAANEAVAAWNATVPSGTPVAFKNEAVPNYRTKGQAWTTNHGAAVIECEGINGGTGFADGPCPLSYLRPMPNWGAAGQTEVMEAQPL